MKEPSIASMRRQRGFGLIGMAAILAALVASAGVLYLSNQAYNRQRNATDDAAALRWADSLLKVFVLQNGRLPCPASEPAGAEDCAAWRALKGSAKWLPSQTLLNQATVSSASITSAMTQMNYQPYRGDGHSATPDLLAAPNREYEPAVGEIVVASGTAAPAPDPAPGVPLVSINGTAHDLPPVAGPTPMNAYSPVVSSLDFCQKLQNLSMGPTGAAAIQPFPLSASNASAINPWQTIIAPVNVYTITTGDNAQTSSMTANALSEVFQCEIVHASADLLATAANISEPQGTVLLEQKGMSNSLDWMAGTLMPQVVTTDWWFSSLRLFQGVRELVAQFSNDTVAPFCIFDPILCIMAAASQPTFILADGRRLTDLVAQTLASANDTAYEAYYRHLDDQVSAMQPWGKAPDQSQPSSSAADQAVNHMVEFGIANSIM